MQDSAENKLQYSEGTKHFHEDSYQQWVNSHPILVKNSSNCVEILSKGQVSKRYRLIDRKTYGFVEFSDILNIF